MNAKRDWGHAKDFVKAQWLILQQEEPDVTLLDIWMPGMDGIEVLKRLKWIAPDCQVIMISGHATISTAMTAVKLGAF
jgi:two-component system nitrogen regulation response regulator NtrX